MQVRKIANRYKSAIDLKSYTLSNTWTNSRLCELKEWDNPEFIKTAQEIMGNHEIPKHRKLWEFTASVLALKELGLLNADSICLSVAAGTERILFYLANIIAGVVASDIYGQGDFSYREANLNFVEDQKNFAPYPYEEKNLTAAYCDALNLQFPDNAFNFSFCLSSIEHFGGINNSRKAISEMARVTKPGGYVIITTEIAINHFKTDEVFSIKDLKNLLKVEGLRLDSEFQYQLSDESLSYLCDMHRDNLNQLPHLNLKTRCCIFTSGILILRKEGKFTTNENTIERKNNIWKIASNLRNNNNHQLKALLRTKIKKKLLNLIWKIQEKFI